VSHTRLYELRYAFLRDKGGYEPKPSGGARRGAWPAKVDAFLEGFLPLQNPPNYQLVADELDELVKLITANK
jgi:hypothetical protein